MTGWMIFEIAINCFQAFLLLMYVKQCFSYEKKNALADGILLVLCAGFLTLLLFFEMPAIDMILFLFPLSYALLLSSEERISVFYWCIVLALVFNAVSMLTYPIFDLLPALLSFEYPSSLVKRFLCICTTNLLLFIVLKLIIRLKQRCSIPGASSYSVFILSLGFLFMTEESLGFLFERFSTVAALPFFGAYIGLTFITILLVFLFRTVSNDFQRKNQYQAEISMLSLSKQHQLELSQMYETLNEQQHDYKHHLQALEALVESSRESAAKSYLDTLIKNAANEEVLVTGSPEVDALLTAKRRTMHNRSIEFKYSPYPLAQLPIAASDLCSIVGNLLDNAIEGVSRMAVLPKEPYIHLSFSRSWNMFYIYCENPCDPAAVIRGKNGFLSSKQHQESGLHGVGLHSIESIAERAQGRAEFEVKDRVFYAKVVLPYLGETTSV